MDKAILDYRKRRSQRLMERGIKPREPSNIDAPLTITAFVSRRNKRLVERGKKVFEGADDPFRMDAPDDEGNNNNNQGGGDSGGGRGNTRLPYGLCMRYGIAIEPGWTPRDAWAALAGKGVTPSGAFERLKRGEDPGVPDVPKEPEVPKSRNVKFRDTNYKRVSAKKGESGGRYELWGEKRNPIRTLEGDDEEKKLREFATKADLYQYLKEQGVEKFTDPDTGEEVNPVEMEIEKEPKQTITGSYGAEYSDLGTYKDKWASRGENPWMLRGRKLEGTGDPHRYTSSFITRTFPTVEDMMYYLREHGIEKIKNPETLVEVNPMEMELPPYILSVAGDRRYKDVSIGLRGGEYTVVGTDLSGKKRTIDKEDSLARALAVLAAQGVEEKDVKLSPSLKKREAERVGWRTSDKVEYVEEDGVKYGDLELKKRDGYWHADWTVIGEDESGEKRMWSFPTKMAALRFLKSQGVEKAREGKERLNPQDIEIPKTVAQVGGHEYQKIELTKGAYGPLFCVGIDLDGDRHRIDVKSDRESYEDFMSRLTGDKDIPREAVTISEETQKQIEEIKKEDEEKARRRAEFEAKAVQIGSWRVVEPYMDFDIDGDWKIYGYDKEGSVRSVTGWGDIHDMVQECKRYGLDPQSLIKRPEVQEKYDKYLEATKDFEEKAVPVGGSKYVGVQITYDGGRYMVTGYDYKGKERELYRTRSAKELDELLAPDGYTAESFPADEKAKKQLEKAKKVQSLVDSGDYYRFGAADDAYTDLRAESDSGGTWKIVGTDAGGEKATISEVSSWDEAITALEREGVKTYKVMDGNKELGMPVNGIHSVVLMRKPDGGGFAVMAATKDRPRATVYETNNEEDARAWLKKNNVPDGGIKTRGMNPNDDKPRTHTAKSLENFDVHRAEKADDYTILRNMSDGEKKATANMLTDMFNVGAYRMNRKDHFVEIVDGEFKNLLQTGTSGGSSSKEGRRRTGEKTFGHPHDIAAKDGEKYGYWGLEDDLASHKDDTAGWYGGINFKFKKDKVGDRVTYTMGDSLDSGRPLAGYAGPNPTIEGVSAFGGKETLNKALRTWRKYKNGEISFGDFREEINGMCRDGYVECQYHGPLTIEDVESVTFTKNNFERTFDEMSAETRKRIVAKLRDKGIILRYKDGRALYDGYEWLEKKYGGI